MTEPIDVNIAEMIRGWCNNEPDLADRILECVMHNSHAENVETTFESWQQENDREPVEDPPDHDTVAERYWTPDDYGAPDARAYAQDIARLDAFFLADLARELRALGVL